MRQFCKRNFEAYSIGVAFMPNHGPFARDHQIQSTDSEVELKFGASD